NFKSGKIDVIKDTSSLPDLPGNFNDPSLPAGYAPFNIALLNGKLYVTYALTQPGSKDELSGPGHGFVNVFNTDGTLVGRLASQGGLNSPWGLAIAPTSFGSIGGQLLVGNFGDGRINVIDPTTGELHGFLKDIDGSTLSIPGLWALTTGNGGGAGSKQKI